MHQLSFRSPGNRRTWMIVAYMLSFVLLHNQRCFGHPSGLQIGDPWWLAWNWDAYVLVVMSVMMVVYFRGAFRAWRRCGFNRGVKVSHAVAYLFGWIAIGAALLSPLDILSDDLAWVHMSQHLLLMLIAAPLISLGHPILAIAWAMPKTSQKLSRFIRKSKSARGVVKSFRDPIVCWLAFALTMWIWHVPVFYEWALVSPTVHDIEHVTFFLSAFLFWRVIWDPRHAVRLSGGVAIVFLFTTALHASLLGGFMTLSPRVWYGTYLSRTQQWEFTPLQDQQLAGLIMWMPGCAVYALAAAYCLARWISELEDAGFPRKGR